MDTLIGQTVGQYQIFYQLGASGAGTVYRAQDTEQDQKVILRFLPQELSSDDAILQQIDEKITQLQALSHTGIAKIPKIEKIGEYAFIVSEYIPKNSLRQRMNKKISWKKAAAILASVARSLEYAHKQNVFHGDLKPTNILFNEDGTPVITDFGLRYLLEQNQQGKLMCSWLGFPDARYIPPEQLYQPSLNASTDIYSLGAIFYEMITGKDLMVSDRPIDMVLEKIKHPSFNLLAHRKHFPDRIIRILTRCLAEKPEDRYQTMSDLARQLERIAFKRTFTSMTQENIPDTLPVKKLKTVHLVGIGALVCLIVAGAFWLWQSRSSAPTALPTQSVGAQSPITPTPKTIVTVQGTSTSIQQPTPTPAPTATMLPMKYPVLMNTPIPQGIQSISVGNSQRLVPLARWGMGTLSQLIWSPDGKFQAMGTSTGVYIIPSDLSHYAHYINVGSKVTSLDYSSDGTQLAIATNDGVVQIWDTNSLEEIISFGGFSQGVRSVKFSHDGQLLAATSGGQNIKIWNLVSKTEIHELTGHTLVVNCLEFSPDDRYLASGSDDLTLKVWSVETGKLLHNIGTVGQVMDIDFSGNGTRLISGGGGNIAQVWNWQTEEMINRLTGYNEVISSVAFSPDDAYILTSDTSGFLWYWKEAIPGVWNFVWKTKSTGIGKILDIENFEYTNSATFSPDGKIISSGQWDGSVDHIDPQDGKVVNSYYELSSFSDKMTISNGSKYLAMQTLKNTVKLWDLTKGQLVFTFPGKLSSGNPFSKNDQLFAMITDSQTLTIYDLITGKEKYQFSGYTNIHGAAFSDDGTYLAVMQEKVLNIWSFGSKQELIVQNKMENQCSVSYLIDGTPLAFGSALGFPGFWNTNSDPLCRLTKPEWVTCLDVLESKTLYALGGISTIQLKNYSSTSTFEQTITNITKLISTSVSFSPDGTIIAGGFNNSEIKVWEVESAKEMITLVGHQYPITSLAFSQNGKYLVSSSLDGLVIVWGVK